MKTDPVFCPHVRKDDFQCLREPEHSEPPMVHRDRDGNEWPMHLPFVEPKIKVKPLTMDEARQVDRGLGAHSLGHATGQLGRDCTYTCRAVAVRDAVNAVLGERP
jgi:hypothetical protein